MKIAKQLIEEYDAAPNDAAWEEGHPIFKMAFEIDNLNGALSLALQTAERKSKRISELKGLLQRIADAPYAMNYLDGEDITALLKFAKKEKG